MLMNKSRLCDICGRSEKTVSEEGLNERSQIQIDVNGLWLCNDCSKRVQSHPPIQDPEKSLDPELKSLIGKSAGAICRTLELPYIPPFDIVIEAASKIAYDNDMFMSAWLFVTLWQNGTSVWCEPDGSATALVTPDGNVNIHYK